MHSTRGKLLASVSVLGVLAAIMSAVVFSSFTSTTESAGNSFAAGSIALSDDDAGSALFNMSGAKPGDTATKCIKVSYASTGSLASTVKLYGTTSGTGLDPYLDVDITRGTGTQANCGDFSGATSVFDDTLNDYPDSYAAGIADADASWSNGESATYRIVVTVLDDNAAQGKNATQTFTWEARSA